MLDDSMSCQRSSTTNLFSRVCYLRTDAIRCRNLLLAVYIDLAEGDTARLALRAGELLEDRADLLAGTAPSSIEVTHQVLSAGEGRLEVRLARDGYDLRHGW